MYMKPSLIFKIKLNYFQSVVAEFQYVHSSLHVME